MFTKKNWLVIYEDGTILQFEAHTRRIVEKEANELVGNHGPVEEIYKRVK